MDKNVVIEVVGTHTADGNSDVIRTKCNGQYYEKSGKHYFLYEELTEQGKLKSIIKVQDESMEVIKKGAVNTHLFFETGKLINCNYDTPFGQLPIDINTEGLNIYIENHRIKVVVSYEMRNGEEHFARCQLQLEAVESEN